jgi:4-hydroxybenzoate polyprenyltransferase
MKKYLSLVKFSHTIFAMPFALIGFFLAAHKQQFEIEWQLLLHVVLAMIFARNAAMGFNRYLDRFIDMKNPRTSQREIPSGQIKDKYALWFVGINSLLFVGATALMNTLVLWLSPIALAVVLGYSYTKRFTALCHFILGLGLALAPIGAYLAVTASFDLIPLLFSFTVLFWTAGFDIIYALQDVDFDKSEKLHSVPVLLGKNNALILSSVLHFIAGLLIIVAGIVGFFSILYWFGAALFISLLIYQHFIVKPHDLSRVNLAFFTTNGIASLLFAVFVIAAILNS